MKDSSVFYTTSNGHVGLVLFSNENLKGEKITYDTIIPHFRAIASNTNNIFALSIGNPSLLYQYDKGNLKLVYKEEHSKVFYDAMDFFDKQNGIAMGDPTDDCLSMVAILGIKFRALNFQK